MKKQNVKLFLMIMVAIGMVFIGSGCEIAETEEIAILEFSFEEQIDDTIFNSQEKTIKCTVETRRLDDLSPEIKIKDGYTIEPESGITQNFAEPVTYILTNNNTGESKEWTVIVSIADFVPLSPLSGWLFNGNAESVNNEINGDTYNVNWSENTHFDYEDNKSLVLDRTSKSWVDFGQPSILDITEEITVSVWVYPEDNDSGFEYVASRWKFDGDNRAWHLVIEDGAFQVSVSPTGAYADAKIFASNFKLDKNEWHHLAFTFKENALRLYVNGVRLEQGNGLSIRRWNEFYEIFAPDSPLLVGTQAPDRDEATLFTGKIDELAIWDSELTAEEIYWLFNNSIRELN